MGRADYYAEGDWNARCSMCGFKRKASTMVKNWQGLYRCPEHDEPRFSQDFVRAVPDVQTPPWTQPGGADIMLAVCTPLDQASIVDLATVDCATIDNIPVNLDDLLFD